MPPSPEWENDIPALRETQPTAWQKTSILPAIARHILTVIIPALLFTMGRSLTSSLSPNPKFYRNLFFVLSTFSILASVFTALIIYRSVLILTRPKPSKRNDRQPGHLLVVLGSGGHTAEMISILETLGPEYLTTRFGRRTWVCSSGDGFSAERARAFEEHLDRYKQGEQPPELNHSHANGTDHSHKRSHTKTNPIRTKYTISTVHRARKVHQPLLTTPVSALKCLWACIYLLYNNNDHKSSQQYPDLILTNGPATGVILILASHILLLTGLAPLTSMRTVYIESWARVRTLSLSGKILRFLTSRFLVQWKGLAGRDLTTTTKEEGDDDDGTIVGGRAKATGKASRRGRILGEVEYIGPVVR